MDVKTILIVDDEEDLREVLQYKFEAKGYNVVTAEDGVQGLEKLELIHPHLIILDMNMPRMDGIEFYKNICDVEIIPKYPVLVLTARANMEKLFRELDIDGFMAKPFDTDQLVAEAETIIKKRYRTLTQEKEEALEEVPGPKTVFVVEDDTDAFASISVCLLKAGYTVNTARTGTVAIEKIMFDPPDLVLVNLSLEDIAGDLVIQRLLRFAKTMDKKYILYTKQSAKLDKQILDRIAKKQGIFRFVEYANPEELLIAVSRAFRRQ
jgi:Response regulator containing CheY-like receiver, AAA-type ATPase, and DNA-binding domains